MLWKMHLRDTKGVNREGHLWSGPGTEPVPCLLTVFLEQRSALSFAEGIRS